jgi:hypothetical protein
MPRPKHLPDPRTNEKRRRQYKPVDGKHVPRAEIIKHIDAHHKGTNLQLIPRIIRAPEKVRTAAKRKGLSKKKTLEKQEQLVSRLVSKWVDHMISGMKEKGLIEHNLSRKAERKLWVQFYNNFLEQIFMKKQAIGIKKKGKLVYETELLKDPNIKAERQAIINEMDQTVAFSIPPKYIIERRAKKSKYSRRAWALIRQNVNPEANLRKEVKRILKRNYARVGRSYSKEQVVQAKAVQVCLAASIYAEILKKTRGENWTTAYGLGMMRIQYLFEHRRPIEKEIINLDKVEISE